MSYFYTEENKEEKLLKKTYDLTTTTLVTNLNDLTRM